MKKEIETMDMLLEMFGGSYNLIIVVISAIMVGFSKTGINGVTMLIIPLLVSVYGGMGSTGILLPMLIVGDLFAVWYYRKSIDMKGVLKPLPWSMLGILLGGFVGKLISDKVFVYLIGGLVVLCLVLLLYNKSRGENMIVPTGAWFYISIGILSGFASMIGNAAGPIFTLYLIALGYNKNVFMGTNALYFLIKNVAKLPIQILLWKNVTVEHGVIAVSMIPMIAIGAILGYFVVNKLNDKLFSYIIIVMTFIGAVRLFM